MTGEKLVSHRGEKIPMTEQFTVRGTLKSLDGSGLLTTSAEFFLAVQAGWRERMHDSATASAQDLLLASVVKRAVGEIR